MTNKDVVSKQTEPKIENKIVECGLIMPISTIDNCTTEHWAEVKAIIIEAVESISKVKFKVNLVSDADDVGIIQKRIIQNVYSSEIVVCDVSGKNSNVMFELGMRLAFDKPVVIVKDDKTDYSFDTGIIEHLSYPRDLRYSIINDFKVNLSKKLLATYENSKHNPTQSPFLKNFGTFKVATLNETTVTSDKLLLNLVEELRVDINRLRVKISDNEFRNIKKSSQTVIMPSSFNSQVRTIIDDYMNREKIQDKMELIGNEIFYSEAERKLDPGKYFRARKDFIDYINDELIPF